MRPTLGERNTKAVRSRILMLHLLKFRIIEIFRPLSPLLRVKWGKLLSGRGGAAIGWSEMEEAPRLLPVATTEVLRVFPLGG